MQDRSFWQVVLDTTQIAAIFGTARALITTPLFEVPLTNVERIKQTQLHQTQRTPDTGFAIVKRLNNIGEINKLLTGAGPNIVKNFSREFARAYGWLLTPKLIRCCVASGTIEKYPSLIPTASVVVVVGVNGTMNSLFDGLRNKQMDTRNRQGISISSLQAGRMLISEYGFLGLFHGAKITYIYSGTFWGIFATSKVGYSRLIRELGFDTHSFYSQTAIGVMSGASAGLATMPIEHLRYQILSGDLPTSPIKAYQAFKTMHGAETGARLFCGLPQSLPIQISASLLAVLLLRFQQQSERSR